MWTVPATIEFKTPTSTCFDCSCSEQTYGFQTNGNPSALFKDTTNILPIRFQWWMVVSVYPICDDSFIISVNVATMVRPANAAIDVTSRRIDFVCSFVEGRFDFSVWIVLDRYEGEGRVWGEQRHERNTEKAIRASIWWLSDGWNACAWQRKGGPRLGRWIHLFIDSSARPSYPQHHVLKATLLSLYFSLRFIWILAKFKVNLSFSSSGN